MTVVVQNHSNVSDAATQHQYKTHQNSHERQDKKFAAMKNTLKYEICSKLCKNKHMNVVHPEVLYQCDLCGRLMKTKGHLSRHIRAHIKKQNKSN